jgi:hypothetical protein
VISFRSTFFLPTPKEISLNAIVAPNSQRNPQRCRQERRAAPAIRSLPHNRDAAEFLPVKCDFANSFVSQSATRRSNHNSCRTAIGGPAHVLILLPASYFFIVSLSSSDCIAAAADSGMISYNSLHAFNPRGIPRQRAPGVMGYPPRTITAAANATAKARTFVQVLEI